MNETLKVLKNRISVKRNTEFHNTYDHGCFES